jgi:hypothetical protein
MGLVEPGGLWYTEKFGLDVCGGLDGLDGFALLLLS